jgi:uncharacterized protein YndB with AHSA1/START domain
MASAAERTPEDGMVHLTRLLKAPRALVWKAWTEPEHFARWFAPRNIAVTNCTIDLRVGGLVRFAHEATDGSGFRLDVQGSFDEIVAPERLVIRFGFVDRAGRPTAPPFMPDWPVAARMLTVVTLEEREGATLLTVDQRVTPADSTTLAAVREERRMAREGWGETLDRLEELVGAAA